MDRTSWIKRGEVRGPVGTFDSVTATSLPPGTPAVAVIGRPPNNRTVRFGIPEGKRGLPGVNAIENDAAVAEYIAALDSATRASLLSSLAPVFASLETLEEVAVMASPSPQTESSRPRFRRPIDRPVLRFADVTEAGSITHPNMVQAPDGSWCLLYSTDHPSQHTASGVFLARSVAGPFGLFVDEGLVFRDDSGGPHHETPWVWWDERLQTFVMTYSLQNSAQSPIIGAIGSQITKWATFSDLVNWTPRGIASDVNPRDPGDGHTGYLRRWMISGRENAYSLWGGTVRGQRALWRRLPGNDARFQRDPRTMSVGKEMMRLMPGMSIALSGTPMTSTATAQGPSAPTTADIGWAASHMDLFAFRGRPTGLFRVGPRQTGGLSVGLALVTGVLSTSINALAEPPTVLDTGAPAPYESATNNFDALGNVFVFEGRCFFSYRTGGHQGNICVGEIY